MLSSSLRKIRYKHLMKMAHSFGENISLTFNEDDREEFNGLDWWEEKKRHG